MAVSAANPDTTPSGRRFRTCCRSLLSTRASWQALSSNHYPSTPSGVNSQHTPVTAPAVSSPL